MSSPIRKCRSCGGENCSLVAEKEFKPNSDPSGPQVKRGGTIYVYRCQCGSAFSQTVMWDDEPLTPPPARTMAR